MRFSSLAAVTAAVLLATAPHPLAAPAAARIVAIGDVHGSADNLVAILQRTGLINAQRQWTGGKTVFVQTGDVTDRGPAVREALDLLMALEKQASAAGGKVLPVLGNHEIMNMVGEARDAAPEVVASFGGPAAYREAFAKDGRYGKWLRSKPVLVEVDDTVFMHAGINLEFTTDSLDAIVKRARREIDEWDAGVRWLRDRKFIDAAAGPLEISAAARAQVEQLNALAAEGKVPADGPKVAALMLPLANLHTSSLFHAQGPLWFRGYATWTDAEGAARMAALLKHHRVKRFVTGHTVQADGRIKPRFEGSLFLIDTGMLGGKYWPNGRPSALDITPAAATPIYIE
jgi:hypothetical protein